MEKIRILQLGKEDWNGIYELPENMCLEYFPVFHEAPEKPYDITFLDREPEKEEIKPLLQAVKTYTLFLTDGVEASEETEKLFWSKKGKRIAPQDVQKFLLEETRYFFAGSYGEKNNLKDIAIIQGFSGKVRWNGNESVELEGDFGTDFQQVAYWRYNSVFNKGDATDIWLEYHHDESVEISLVASYFPEGSVDYIAERRVFCENELKKTLHIKAKSEREYPFFSLQAKGKGKLRIIALHKRLSRGSHGHFLPGGERYVTSAGEEVFCYFDPCDGKPPLNVYFSGYKMQEGFEGYHMLKNMKSPFLLISESRLEGGAFYMGSEEYEKLCLDAIRKYMRELGFSSDEVIFSGLSMGTYGALYYGCDILPHALILGKPLASIGSVAANEKYLRSGGFPTSLDVLWRMEKSLSVEAAGRLNGRFWDKFDAADWGRSKFIVSYMIEDDYDPDAYETLLSHLRSGGVQIYGKGNHGRHNDNTNAIVSWFSDQFRKVLREDFGREA